jgi:hypothetical protein
MRYAEARRWREVPVDSAFSAYASHPVGEFLGSAGVVHCHWGCHGH